MPANGQKELFNYKLLVPLIPYYFTQLIFSFYYPKNHKAKPIVR